MSMSDNGCRLLAIQIKESIIEALKKEPDNDHRRKTIESLEVLVYPTYTVMATYDRVQIGRPDQGLMLPEYDQESNCYLFLMRSA